MNTTNYFRMVLALALACGTAGCTEYDKFRITEKPYVNKTSVELYVGEQAGDRNKIQLKSSPEGRQYTWSSLDPSVATVDQTGLITAQSEGFAVITIASDDDQTNVNVWVRSWVPLVDFTLSKQEKVILGWKDRFQIVATPVPQNASEPDIRWSSSAPNVATVLENGWVTCDEAGSAVITASANGIEKTLEVWVLAPVKMPKTNWSIPGYDPDSNHGAIGYSSQHMTESNRTGILAVIDNDLGTYWHASYSNPASQYPHWFIIDLGEEVATVTHVSMARRNGDNRGQKGFEVFTCIEADVADPSDPDTWGWTSQGEFSFNPNKDGNQQYLLENLPSARYIKVFIAEKYKGANDYAMVSDFSIYIQ